jgi:Hint domain
VSIEFNWGQSGTLEKSGTSVVVNAETVNQNDLLIAVVVPESAPGDEPPGKIVAPPGWAVLDSSQLSLDTNLPTDATIFYKIADGNSAESNYTFTWDNPACCSWTLLDYSGVDTSSPIEAIASQTSGGYSTDTTAPSVMAAAGDTLVNVWISKGGAEDYRADPSTTERADTHSRTVEFPEIMAADKSIATTGETGSDTMTERYTTINQTGYSIVLNAAVCFMPGTMVRTPDGEVAVETLKRGDLVTTTDGRAKIVSWIGRQTVSMRFADPLRVLPIRIKAGALGENVPSRDLLISPDHAILVGEILIQAGALVNGLSIVRETEVPQTFTYFHVELEDHSLILAENTAAETFVDNVDRLAFDNWQEHEALYPEGKPIIEMPYPRAKAHRQVPPAIRERLACRASVLMLEPKNHAA